MKNYKKYLAIAISLVLLLTAVFFIRDESYASTVVVEINPSVQLKLNSDEVVTEAEAMNEDAESFAIEILIGMKVEDAIEDITNQAIENDFLDIDDLEDDFIVISAVSKDDKNDIEEALDEKRENSNILKAANIAILWAEEKDVENAKEQGKAVGLTALREKYGLKENETLGDYFSSSKNREEVQKNNKIIEEDLDHKIEHVNEYIEKMDIDDEIKEEIMSKFLTAKEEFMNSINTMQEAKKAYQEALDSEDEEAIEEAKAFMEETEKAKDKLESIKDEIEEAKNIMLAEYEEQIKEVKERIKTTKENTKKHKTKNNYEDIDMNQLVDHEEAIDIALAETDGGIVMESKLDEDDDRYMYEVEIQKEGMEYELEIDAYTGEVLNSESNDEEDGDENIDMDQLVGHKKAIETALNKTDGGIIMEVKLDEDDDRYVYEVEIRKEGMEYELEIDAYTGEVLNSESDDEKDEDENIDMDQLVGHEKAKEIALAETDGGIIIEVKLDEDDDKYMYEVEIQKDDMEYEIEIDAHTGEVLNSKIDD